MEIMLKYLRVGKDGQVIIIKNVSTRKTLPLILSARFIANKVDKNIKEHLSREELSTYSLLKKDVFVARFNEIIRDGFVERNDDEIKVRNILLIERFLENFEEKGKV